MNTFLDILRDIVSAKLFIFISGFISGVLACWHFCPAYWEWRTHRLNVECKNKEDRKAAALRRLESRKARAAEQERKFKENAKLLVESISKVTQDFSGSLDDRTKHLQALAEHIQFLNQQLRDTITEVERRAKHREFMDEFVFQPTFGAVLDKIKNFKFW